MIVLKKIHINKNIPTAIYNVFRDPCCPNIQNNIKYLRKILIVFLADLFLADIWTPPVLHPLPSIALKIGTLY